MKKAVNAENLTKIYTLGAARHDSLRDALSGFLRRTEAKKGQNLLHALKNVSFEVGTGETLGIIGNNGAGKSTLLKILSRVTKPTSGTAELCGRVGSLLEVGTGFHNELSGRENIYLNGAIIGMRRAEIERKFDEIVAFSEVEKFLDTPVKHYSSGMYMRLAFSVAAHLDPEILIVDEVLAVGDANFQRKCLNKMKDVSQSGRTVIFVSHDMAAVTRICSRAIALSGGEVVLEGEASAVVREYLHSNLGISAARDFTNVANPPQSESVRLKRVRVVDERGETTSGHDIRRRIGIEATYEAKESGQILVPNFQIYNEDRVQLFTVQDVSAEWHRRKRERGEYTSRVWIPANFMAEGTFFVNFAVVTYLPAMNIHFNQIDVVSFDVVDSLAGDTARGDYAGRMDGVIRPILEWETEYSAF